MRRFNNAPPTLMSTSRAGRIRPRPAAGCGRPALTWVDFVACAAVAALPALVLTVARLLRGRGRR